MEMKGSAAANEFCEDRNEGVPGLSDNIISSRVWATRIARKSKRRGSFSSNEQATSGMQLSTIALVYKYYCLQFFTRNWVHADGFKISQLID